MPPAVGIPRAMGYYYLYPYYLGFLRELGIEPVLSAPTSNRTLRGMSACPTDEPCVSVKLAFAHSEELLARGVDCLFIPVLSSVDPNNYCCPKHIGLPHMIRNGLSLTDQTVIAPRIDVRDAPDGGKSTFYDAARKLGVRNPLRVRSALAAAERMQEGFRRLTTGGLTILEALASLEGTDCPVRRTYNPHARYNPDETAGVIAHAYTLHDPYSFDIVGRVREYGNVLTPEMVEPAIAKAELATIWQGERMWEFEAGMVGAALHWLRSGSITRLIMLGPFECGPEAIIESFIEAECERYGVPLLLLTVDEQTGEAGISTRLEAFFDTEATNGRQRAENFVPGPRAGGRIVAAPSMGSLDIATSTMFQELGIDWVPTPPLTRRTVELGLELAPEFICYPMVTTIGQMREALDLGADCVFMVGGKGRCRLGWYGQVQEELLRRAGYRFRMLIIDSPFPLHRNWGGFSRSVHELAPNKSWSEILAAFRLGYAKVVAADSAGELVREARATERDRGAADRALSVFLSRLAACGELAGIRRLSAGFGQQLSALPRMDVDPVRVRIVGEIYVICEEFVNTRLEKTLGGLDTRVDVQRELTTAHWAQGHLLCDPRAVSRRKKIARAARPYLPEPVGGHGLESVGLTVLAPAEGCDGVVHLMPFTCMPEIVAQNILATVAHDLDIPLLTLIISEQTGEAGIKTRLEAFVDVLSERRGNGVR